MTKSVKMKSELNARLLELKEEYQKGQERLIALEQETANLSKTMLRISGAIQVLEELIGDTSGNSNDMNTDLEKAKNSEK
jgi:predicted nuclease with TOPRIM domain